jgi:hypothetical protein
VFFFIYGAARRGVPACFIRRESALARPRRFVPGATVLRAARRRRRFFLFTACRSAARPHVSSTANPLWRGRGDSYQAPRCGARRSGGGVFLFYFKRPSVF